MIPVEKEWTNIVMGEGQSHVLPCPARKEEDGQIMIEFELTDEEVEAIVKNKTVMVNVFTYNKAMQPIQLWATDKDGKPITDPRIPKD